VVPRGGVKAVRVPWEQQPKRVMELLWQIVMMALPNMLQGTVDGVVIGASRHNQFLVIVCTYYTVHACNQFRFEANS